MSKTATNSDKQPGREGSRSQKVASLNKVKALETRSCPLTNWRTTNNPSNRAEVGPNQTCFELYGCDVLVDAQLRPWLPWPWLASRESSRLGGWVRPARAGKPQVQDTNNTYLFIFCGFSTASPWVWAISVELLPSWARLKPWELRERGAKGPDPRWCHVPRVQKRGKRKHPNRAP